MSDERCCGPLCQHPGCWLSGKIQMLEALKRFTLVEPRQRSGDRSVVERKVLDHKQESLPTLKVVNLIEREDDLNFDGDHRDFAYDIPPQIPHVAIRPSKNQRSNCVTPFPSVASHCFTKKEKLTEHTECSIFNREINFKTQTTCITIQETGDNRANLDERKMPCLVWIPSKKSKKKRKNGVLVNNLARKMDMPRIHTKNITGSNSEFGFLTTPFNKEGCVKCYSRATHALRSSPTKSHPKRLPPMSSGATEKSSPSKDFRLSGDGMFTSMRISPGLGTPQNTRISIFAGEKPEDCSSVCSREHDEFVKKESSVSLPVVDKEVVLEHYNSSDVKSMSKPANKVLKESREEITLPRVSLPKAKLKQLAIEDHCKNSVPSHQLYDIQMQPIYGTESTISSHSAEMTAEKTGKNDWENREMGVNEETRLSNENYGNGYEVDGDSDLASREEVISAWEFEELHAPMPTPITPAKQADTDVHGDIDVIELIRQEQERASVTETRSMNQMANDDVRKSKIASLIASPVPSKSSSDEWPSDRDIMRQTYERYRSFTPFKTTQINLSDMKLASIKEASREHTLLTAREKSLATPPEQTASMPRHVTGLTSNNSKVEAESMRSMRNHPKRANQFTINMRSVSSQRPQIQNITEINVSAITPRERSFKSKVTQWHSKKPYQIHTLPLEITSSSCYPEHVPARAIYEALVNAQNMSEDVTKLTQANAPAASLCVTEQDGFCDTAKGTPGNFMDAKNRDTNHGNAKEDGGNLNDTYEDSRRTGVDVDSIAGSIENGAFNDVNKEVSYIQSTLNQTEPSDKDALSGVGVDFGTENNCIGDVNDKFNSIEIVTNARNEGEDALTHEDGSLNHTLPNKYEGIAINVEEDELLYTESNSYFALASPNRSLGPTSSAEGGESDAEFNLNIESSLDFLSFSSEFNLSLDLEGIKEEFDKY